MAATKVYYYTTAKGSRIFIEECGSGPLMVLMHGLGGSTNYFQPLINHFSLRYTILRFDFPGSGLSTFQSPLSIAQFVEDLGSILESRGGNENPILVGHSLGSMVAMHYASLHQVQALVLIGPGRSASHIEAVVARMQALAAKARGGIQHIRDSVVETNVAPSSSDVVRAFVRQVVSSQDPEGYAATCEAICAKSHVDPDYAVIKCATVLITGDQDNISPHSRSLELKELIGGAEKDVEIAVVHSGHQHVLEDTDGVIKAIDSILASL